MLTSKKGIFLCFFKWSLNFLKFNLKYLSLLINYKDDY